MQFQSASDQQPIKVTISSSATVGAASSGGDDLLTSNITFRISDQGGGFSRELLLPDNPHSIWSFSHCQKHFMRNSTDIKDDKRHPTDMPQVAGKLSDPSSSSTNLHIGLQLARVFANYWGGDLKICTMYGYGSDAYVRIVTGGEHEERLTISSIE
jgi:hypothetical protein